jgi:hypothetical protein
MVCGGEPIVAQYGLHTYCKIEDRRSQRTTYIMIVDRSCLRSKAWVYGCWLSGIARSNPTGNMDVCLLCGGR